MTTAEDLGDADGLLRYDPALVVFGQLRDGDVLDKLSGFASKLTRYVEMAKENQPRHEHNDIDPLAAKGKKQEAETDEEVDRPKANASNEASDKRDKTEASDSESTSDADALTSRREEDATEPSPKRQRVEVASKTIQPAMLCTEMEPPDGYKGKLFESRLKTSVGLTRKTLNLHLQELGLTASFLIGAVSKNGEKVSHLTLSPQFEKLPYSSHQKLQMWLGVGPTRRKLAIPLFPDSNPQPAIPIFWAEKPYGTRCGAASCYYIGHFRCVKFEELNEIVVRMDAPRQALLEFEFVEFNSDMANKLAEIAAEKN